MRERTSGLIPLKGFHEFRECCNWIFTIDGRLGKSDLPKVTWTINGRAGQELKIPDSQYLFGGKSLKQKWNSLQ